jgi:hypothetical protein
VNFVRGLRIGAIAALAPQKARPWHAAWAQPRMCSEAPPKRERQGPVDDPSSLHHHHNGFQHIEMD